MECLPSHTAPTAAETQLGSLPAEGRHGAAAPLVRAWLGGGILLLAAALPPWPGDLQVLHRTIAGMLLAIAIAQVVCSCVRWAAGHWELASLLPALMSELLLLAVIPLFAGTYVMATGDPSHAWLAVLAVTLSASSLLVALLETGIGARLAAAGKPSVTTFLADMRWRTRRVAAGAPDASLLTAMEMARPSPIPEAAVWLLTVPPGQRLSQARIVMTAALVIAGCGLAAAPVRAVLVAETASTLAPLEREWARACSVTPGARAPAPWIRAELRALYLGPREAGHGPPPGARAGCTGAVLSVQDASGTFYFTVGTDPRTGDLVSVAVTSRAAGSTLFAGRAAAMALAWILQARAIDDLSRRVAAPPAPIIGVNIGRVVIARTP